MVLVGLLGDAMRSDPESTECGQGHHNLAAGGVTGPLREESNSINLLDHRI